MNTESPYNIVYSRNVIEFITVAVEYCSFLEKISEYKKTELTDTLTKILPLLYLKSSLLPSIDIEYEIYPEISVDESTYNYILSQAYDKYKGDDTYLEVFLDDMKYSDTPISASISEDLTDIYQDLKNFASIYQRGIEESMYEALIICQENFVLYWGQKLVNVLRALHSLKYGLGKSVDDMGDELFSDNIEEEW